MRSELFLCEFALRCCENVAITKCWTEAPDGPFHSGSRVDGGSVNIAVLLV